MAFAATGPWSSQILPLASSQLTANIASLLATPSHNRWTDCPHVEDSTSSPFAASRPSRSFAPSCQATEVPPRVPTRRASAVSSRLTARCCLPARSTSVTRRWPGPPSMTAKPSLSTAAWTGTGVGAEPPAVKVKAAMSVVHAPAASQGWRRHFTTASRRSKAGIDDECCISSSYRIEPRWVGVAKRRSHSPRLRESRSVSMMSCSRISRIGPGSCACSTARKAAIAPPSSPRIGPVNARIQGLGAGQRRRVGQRLPGGGI
jgi:hypothetical protein